MVWTAILTKRPDGRTLKSKLFYAIQAMLIGPIGTGLLPPSVFGLFERFSTFSAVIFNAVLGMYLFKGKFDNI